MNLYFRKSSRRSDIIFLSIFFFGLSGCSSNFVKERSTPLSYIDGVSKKDAFTELMRVDSGQSGYRIVSVLVTAPLIERAVESGIFARSSLAKALRYPFQVEKTEASRKLVVQYVSNKTCFDIQIYGQTSEEVSYSNWQLTANDHTNVPHDVAFFPSTAIVLSKQGGDEYWQKSKYPYFAAVLGCTSGPLEVRRGTILIMKSNVDKKIIPSRFAWNIEN